MNIPTRQLVANYGIILIMKYLTARQIAENTGTSTASVYKWLDGDMLPETVARKLRSNATYNFKKAAALSEIAQKQRALAEKIEQEATQ